MSLKRVSLFIYFKLIDSSGSSTVLEGKGLHHLALIPTSYHTTLLFVFFFFPRVQIDRVGSLVLGSRVRQASMSHSAHNEWSFLARHTFRSIIEPCQFFAFARTESSSRQQEQRAEKKCYFFHVNMLYFLNSLYLFVTISMYFLAIFLKFSYIIKQRK